METSALVTILPPEMGTLRARPLLILSLEVAAKPQVVGPTPAVDRRVAEILGGRFEGERLNGKVLPGGSDWLGVRSDGTWALDVRLVMETDDGALIAMSSEARSAAPCIDMPHAVPAPDSVASTPILRVSADAASVATA